MLTKCIYCGDWFNRFPSRVRSTSNYCSVECWNLDGHPTKQVETPEIRFWRQVVKTDTCWLWNGRATGGYGKLVIDGKIVGAHRYSWELHNGEIPVGIWVLHNCDVCPCVNPSHLFLGRAQDNTDDMIQKCRQKFRSPIKLTPNDIVKMRNEYRMGNVSMSDLGRRYSINSTTVHAIIHRKIWKSIP